MALDLDLEFLKSTLDTLDHAADFKGITSNLIARADARNPKPTALPEVVGP